MAKRLVTVVGFDYHATYLARMINRYSETWEAREFPSTRLGMLRAMAALRSSDALISFGGPGPSGMLAEFADLRYVPVMVIWAGTDVQKVAKDPFDLVVQQHFGFHNVAVAEWLVEELRLLGVHATYVPVGSVEMREPIRPFPEAFRVLTYLPEPRREFYGQSRVFAIARQLPDVEFLVVGPGAPTPNAPLNVTFLGYEPDVCPSLDASTAYLRLPDHDGRSMLVLEALARGRHVVWTYRFPGVYTVGDVDEALAVLRKLRDAHRRGELALNDAGRAYVESNYSRSRIAKRFEVHLNRIASRGVRHKNGRARRVAISGLDLFAAEMAAQVERLHPDWRASILRTRSRLEVLISVWNLARSDLWYSIGNPMSDRWLDLFAAAIGIPRVMHWVGSDIQTLRNSASLRRRVSAPLIRHLTEVDWTAAELLELGIDSEIAPLPLRHRTGGVKALPQRFTILLYLPATRPVFYGQLQFEHLLNELRHEDIKVLVVGGGTLKAPPEVQVVNLGWRGNLREIYEQSTVLIRLTPRDGLSLMVLEALSFGRYVIWSKPFRFVTSVRHRSDLIDSVRALLRRHCEGRLFAQYVAAETIARSYSDEAAVDRIVDQWERARSEPRRKDFEAQYA